LSPGVQERYLLPILCVSWVSAGAIIGNTILKQLERRLKPISGISIFLAMSFLVLFFNKLFYAVDELKTDRLVAKNCGFCEQLEMQKDWMRLSKKIETIYSFSDSYTADLEILNVAPTHAIHLPFDQKENLPSSAWVVIGEWTRSDKKQWVKENLISVFEYPRGGGFYIVP